MSIKLMSQVWDLEMESATQKLILLKLADNANDSGECFPSMKTIAKHCGCSRTTVARHIKSFKEQGLLSTSHRYRDDGGYSSNNYQLHLPATPCNKMTHGGHVSESDRGCVTGDTGGVSESDRGSVTELQQEPSVKPSKESSKEPSNIIVQTASCFDRVWMQYPTKVNKKKSRQLFESYIKKHKLNPVEFTEMLLMDIAKRCESEQFGFDKLHFTTYINQERWNDEYTVNKNKHQAKMDRTFELIDNFDLEG